MGFLRLLFSIPFYLLYIIWEACLYFIKFLAVFLCVILWFFSPVIGKINWSTPKWYSTCKNGYISLLDKAKSRSALIGSIIIAITLTSFAANYIYHWNLNRATPIEHVSEKISIHSPRYFPPEESNSLFYTGFFDENTTPPAPLELIGKKIMEGVSLTPQIEGKWVWSNDRLIEFTPKNSWPLGVEYTVKYDDDKLFAKNNILNENLRPFSFKTKDFSYRISDEELYQDPINPNNRMGIFTISFSHPVDKEKFKKQISLSLYEKNKSAHQNDIFVEKYDYSVQFDDEKNVAYIKSSQIDLPEKNSYLRLSIEKGVTSSLGGTPTDTLTQASLMIPNKFNLAINSFEVSLVEVNNQEMRQLLNVSLNYNVNPFDLSKELEVWQLPVNDKKEYTQRYYDQLDRMYKTKILVDQNDLKHSKKLDLKVVDTGKNYQNSVSFEFSSEQNRHLYIRVNQPLISDGGYYLSSPYHGVEQVPMYPVIMNFAAEGSLLSLSGDKKIPIVSRNMSSLKLDIQRVIPSQLQHLISFNQKDFQNMNFGNVRSEHFVEKYSVIKTIEGSPDSVKYTDIDISEYLEKDLIDGQSNGVFLVRLYGNKNNNKKERFDYYKSRFILVTDMGIINKKSLDQSHDIFVQSIRSGLPIEDATVSVIGTNGIEITSAQTDSDGHVHFSPLSEYYQGIKPLFFVVNKNDDLSFLPISSYDRQLNFSRFDVGGVYESVDGSELRSHLFSDRGIYRPGDTFNIGIIVKTQEWGKSLSGVRLEVDIYDPKSNRVMNKPIMLDEYGFEEVSYQTEYSSPTGEWYVNLYLKNPNDDYRVWLGSTSVTVREFEPDKTTVELTLLPKIKEGWLHPDELSAKIEAKNLFGTPAQNRVVKSQLYLEPSAPYFKQYEDYVFYQNIHRYQNSFDVAVEETITDSDGFAELDLPIDRFEGNYTAKLLTEVFEPESGRSVAATSSVFVSPNAYLIGSKTDGRLDYIKKDSTRTIDLIAVDSNLDKIDLSSLTLVKLEQKYLSVLVKQPSGVYKYQSELKNILLSETPFAISASSTKYIIANEEPGNYLIQIKNKGGNIIYQTAYSIAGTANVTRNLDRNAELALKIDNNQYRAGDEIEVSITAPYIGSGIMTIERDKVYSWKWFNTTTTSSVQTITVPEGIDGNAYINVQFVRDPSSNEIFMSPLSYAVAPFKISNDKFDDQIKLDVPDHIRPGDRLPITINTQSKQRVIIFAVDEGILQVSGYKLKNPLSEFIRKKTLSVRTSQILDLILPEYQHLLNASAPGGGDTDQLTDELSAHLNPFKRKIDKPVTYWSGIIDVDGSKTVEYDLPDYFNGKIRIMAVSVGKKTMGHAQTTRTVKNDFVLSPNIPYFVAPDDEFEISLSVSNNLDNLGNEIIPIEIKLETTPHLTLLDEPIKTVNLGSMQEVTLKYRLKATNYLGSGDFHFTASYAGKTVERKVSTSVRPTTPYRLTTIMGRIDGDSESFSDLREMHAPFSERTASTSYSPFVLSKGLATYLENYPHYCSEQIISKAMPLLIDRKYPDFELVKNNDIGLESLFQILQTRQNNDGAIGLWYSTYDVDPFLTLYAVNFMLEAKEAGQPIPSNMLHQANNYIQKVASSKGTDQYELRLRAYAIYLLTRQSNVTTNYLASIMEDLNYERSKWWETDLTALYLASSYQMLKMDKEANKLFAPIWQDLSNAYDNAWWNNNYYDPLVINSGKIYLIAKHFSDKVDDIPAQALENLVIMLGQDRYTTQSSAMTMLALDSYASSINLKQLTEDDLTITSEAKNDQQNKLTTIAKLQGLLAKGQFSADTQRITFNNEQDLPAWYLLSEQGFDKTIQQKSFTQGLEVYRDFTDENGNTIDKVTLGDTINVTVKVRALSKEGEANIAIVDLLPGGFEVVQQPINNEGEESYNDDGWLSPIAIGEYSWYPNYTDVREDRVIIYGSLYNSDVKTFKYQIKATNVGEYSVPSAYGEAMYNRDIQAVSKGGDTISVIPR